MGNAFSKKKKNRKCLMFGLKDSGKTTILYKLKIGETIATKSTIGFNYESVLYKGWNFDIYDIGWIFHEHNLYDPNNINHIDISKIEINETEVVWPRKMTSRNGKDSDLERLRQIYLEYDTKKLFENTHAVIIVIDCNNKYAINHSDEYISDKSRDVVDDEYPIKPSLRQINIVAGYCRDNEKNYNLNIPNGIIDICVAYYALNQSVKDLLHFVLNMPEWKEIPILIWANKLDMPNAMLVRPGVCEELNLGSTDGNNPDVMKDREDNWYIQGACATTGDGLYEGWDWLCQKMKKK